MGINEKRYAHLEKEVGFDYILETREAPDFTEFVTSTGGDVDRYRVYGTSEDNFFIGIK